MSRRAGSASAASAASAALAAYDDLPVTWPWRAVLPLRHVDRQGPRVRLHTVQTCAAWTRLVADGVLRGDPNLAQPDFARAYAWMESQMTGRGLPGEGMLWLWARCSRRGLWDHAVTAPGQVLITVEIDSSRVLISHFGDWHCVLNDGPVVPWSPGESGQAFDRRFDAVQAAGRAAVMASWDDVLDPSRWASGDDLQATVREIRSVDVVRAVRIRERRRRHRPRSLRRA